MQYNQINSMNGGFQQELLNQQMQQQALFGLFLCFINNYEFAYNGSIRTSSHDIF